MSREDRFDRADFESRYGGRVATSVDMPATVDGLASRGTSATHLVWPIARAHLRRVGESVLADRNGQGRPHKGIDLFADAGTQVFAAQGGQVVRVVDGRQSQSAAQRRAGLFVDVRGNDALIYRYLHLGSARVEAGASIRPGAGIGTVAAPHTSGLAETPHLHFEVRSGDFDRSKQDYGSPLDPLRLLPSLRA